MNFISYVSSCKAIIFKHLFVHSVLESKRLLLWTVLLRFSKIVSYVIDNDSSHVR